MLLATAEILATAPLNVAETFAEELSSAPNDEAAQKSLEVGVDAYHEGALEASIEALSGALQGNLSLKQIGEAHYFRGLAYRELGKPGRAIADLTHAISLKGALSKAHLKDAAKNRARAYREAGLTGTELVVVAEPGILDTGSSVSLEQPPQRDSLTTSSIGSTAPGWGTPATTTPPPLPMGAPMPFDTLVTAAPAAPLQEKSSATEEIRLQVARVRSHSEAYAVAVRLISQHGREFSAGNLKIEETIPDSGGSVFTVQLGPYVAPLEAQQFCARLRRSSFDCVVEYRRSIPAASAPIDRSSPLAAFDTSP